jgi:hypothetical protein
MPATPRKTSVKNEAVWALGGRLMSVLLTSAPLVRRNSKCRVMACDSLGLTTPIPVFAAPMVSAKSVNCVPGIDSAMPRSVTRDPLDWKIPKLMVAVRGWSVSIRIQPDLTAPEPDVLNRFISRGLSATANVLPAVPSKERLRGLPSFPKNRI